MKWNTALYDNNHAFVSKYGEDLIGLLTPQKGESILDLGCGTGDLAEQIRQSGAMVIGIDSSKEMVDTARDKYPHIQFDIQSADDFNYSQPFDAVFSNATLHWVLQYEQAVTCICKALKPNGRFVAEMGGQGNVSNIIHALKKVLEKSGYRNNAQRQVWYFPSLSQYTSLLEQNGFRVVLAAHFDRQTLLKENDGIRSWLKMFGQTYLQGIDDSNTESILKEVEDLLRPTNFKDNNWYADYVRLRIVAIKR